MMGARRALLVWIAAAMLVAVLPGAAVAEKTVSITASSFDFSVAAGQNVSGTLSVINDGDEPMNVFIYAVNQVVAADGEIGYTAPTMDTPASERGAAAWITIKVPADARTVGNVPYVETKPGDTFPVAFTVEVPPDAPPGDHQVIIFFEIDNDTDAAGSSSAKVSGRLGSRIRLRIKGEIVERIDVRPFVARALVIGQALPYTFRINNGGNVDKTVTGRLSLLDGSDREVLGSVPASDAVVYAGTSSEYSGVVTATVGPGKYTLRLTTEYKRESDSQGASGIPEQLIEDRVVWIVPLWLAIGVVVLAGFALLWVSWQQTVRAARRKAQMERRRSRKPVSDELGESDTYRATTTE